MSLVPYIIAVASMVSSLDEATAREHVQAAYVAAQKYDLPLELLLGMAYIESRYDPADLSRIECHKGKCVRVTGRWYKTTKPPRARPTYYCGAMQVGGNVSWDRCQELRENLQENYLEGAQHLVEWMDDPHCRYKKGRAKLLCGLAGYGGGYRAIKNGSKSGYPTNCLAAAKRVEQFAEHARKKAAEPRM